MRHNRAVHNHAVIRSRDAECLQLSYIKTIYDHVGYLKKRGKMVKNWKRRLFVIQGNNFKYFKDVMNTAKPLGAGQCKMVEYREGKPNGLVLTCESGRKYYLECNCVEDRERWAKAFSAAAAKGIEQRNREERARASDGRLLEEMALISEQNKVAPLSLSDLGSEMENDHNLTNCCAPDI